MSERRQSEGGRSAVSGKKIKLKLKKSKQDKEVRRNKCGFADALFSQNNGLITSLSTVVSMQHEFRTKKMLQVWKK